MGVAGSGKDTRSEHPDRPPRVVAGAGDSFGMGAVSRVSIDYLHRSLDRCGRLPVATEGGDAQVLNRNVSANISVNPAPKKGILGAASLKLSQPSDDKYPN